MNKTTNTNPRGGLFHERGPSETFKTARGGSAFGRLKVFEDVSAKYEKATRRVVPHAMRVVTINKEPGGEEDREFQRVLQAEECGDAEEGEGACDGEQSARSGCVKFLETYVE